MMKNSKIKVSTAQKVFCSMDLLGLVKHYWPKLLLVKQDYHSLQQMALILSSRVKDLFANARSFAPSISFIDEIKRGGPDIGGDGAEREQGLLQILTEMDEFKVSTSQGRFDKIIRVGLPSKDGRLAILKTDIKSIRSKPNMRYTEISGKVFLRKSDYINSIVLHVLLKFAARVIEEEMFGVDNMRWISTKATLEASRLAEFLVLQTGMTAFGKAYYRNQNDLVPNLAAKLEALRDEYMRYSVEKCASVLREFHSAVETITDILLDMGEIKTEEIWDIYNRAPRISQPTVNPVDENGALIYAGRWGIHGITLLGRITFAPGNAGFSTFGAPRPMVTQTVSDENWKLIDNIWDKRVEIKAEASMEVEEDKEKPQLLMASHFL
ncbi:hypothetical protein CRYUN_Cryun15aG0072600 [Craigia yunnanensis]